MPGIDFSSILKDAGTGATAGSVIPGVGTAIGAGTGAAFGILQGIIGMGKANKAGNQANNLQPPLYDPQQLAMLDEIQQRRKSLQTGSAFAGGMGLIDSTTAGTNQAITEVTGGDIGNTIQGLLSAQSNAGIAKNQLLGESDTQNQFYSTLGADLQSKISSRAMELQLAMQAQKRAEWAQGKQDATGNLNAGVALTDPGSIDWMDLLKRHMGGDSLSLQSAKGINDIPDSNMINNIPQVGGDLSALSSVLG